MTGVKREDIRVDFARFNLNSTARQAFWKEQEERIRTLLEQIGDEAFEGQASIKSDHVARFSGLARPNLALGTTTDLAGFIAVCVSPGDPDQLRVLASNGHTAARYDTAPEQLEEALARGLERWISQPMYRQRPDR
jgi:hypothetical protein